MAATSIPRLQILGALKGKMRPPPPVHRITALPVTDSTCPVYRLTVVTPRTFPLSLRSEVTKHSS